MKVYIVGFQIDYEGGEITEVFDSKEKAIHYISENNPSRLPVYEFMTGSTEDCFVLQEREIK